MKKFIILLSVLMLTLPNGRIESMSKRPENHQYSVPLILPSSLNKRRKEFIKHFETASLRLSHFAKKYGWEEHLRQPFVQLFEIYTHKNQFDQRAIYLVDADLDMQLPSTFVAGLEKQVLFTVTPEMYLELYPEGKDEQAYEKLLTHELAHRLHIRILNGHEDKMGPIWFFEAFATFAADQFPFQKGDITAQEVEKIITKQERGSYKKYNQVLKYFLKRTSLSELILQASHKNFHQWLRQL